MDNFYEKKFSKITLTAIEAAIMAGKILKEGYRTKYNISKKSGKHNLVTEYDLKSEKAIMAYISEKYPNDSFLCEEEGIVQKDGEIQWIIDPLDGTVNFAHEIPMFAVNIAARKDDNIISGVTYHPLLEELFVAEKGKGAFLNGEKLEVSKTKDLDEAILSTGFPYDLIDNPNKCVERFLKILKLGLPIRRIGAAALDLAYVAAGRFDVFWETGLGAWDCAPGILLIEEAGGVVTHFDGSKVSLKNTNNAIVATNLHLHTTITELFKKI